MSILVNAAAKVEQATSTTMKWGKRALWGGAVVTGLAVTQIHTGISEKFGFAARDTISDTATTVFTKEGGQTYASTSNNSETSKNIQSATSNI